MEVVEVLTNASDLLDRMKQEMQAIKVTSNAELHAIQKAIKRIEEDIQNSAGGTGGKSVGWQLAQQKRYGAQGNRKSQDIRQ